MSYRKTIPIPSAGRAILAVAVLCGSTTAAGFAAGSDIVTIERLDGRLRVLVDGQLFTEYVYRVINRPVLYPIVGPHGIRMTRNYPMKKDAPGEEHDHPHHTSIWYAHSPVNGVDFFSVREDAGRIVHDEVLDVRGGADRGWSRPPPSGSRRTAGLFSATLACSLSK
jgi:hypothetical protein